MACAFDRENCLLLPNAPMESSTTINDECVKVTGQRLSCVSASQCIRFVPELLGGQEIMKQRGPMHSEGAHVHKGAGNSVPVLCSTCCTIEMVQRHGCRSWWEISRYKFPCIFKFVAAGQLLVIMLQVTCLSLHSCGARALHFLVRTSCRGRSNSTGVMVCGLVFA